MVDRYPYYLVTSSKLNTAMLVFHTSHTQQEKLIVCCGLWFVIYNYIFDINSIDHQCNTAMAFLIL